MNTHLKPISRWVAAGLITIGAGTLTSQALASTLAGTEIKNEAKVTYTDEYDTPLEATSNLAIVKVAQIYSAELKTDFDGTAAAGQVKYIVHSLTNTGNGPEEFTLTFAQDLPAGDGRGPDDIDADSIELFYDADGTGAVDSGEVAIASGSVVTIPAGETYQYIVAVAVPSSAAEGNKIGVTLTAQAHEGTGSPVVGKVTDTGTNNDGAPDTNGDLITITKDAVINVTKSATEINGGTETSTGIDIDGDAGTDLPVNIIEYKITASNTGDTAATDVHIFDGIPENTKLVPGSVFSPGLISADGDTPAVDVPDLTDETAYALDLDQDGSSETGSESDIAGGLDLNHNGTVGDATVPGVYAVDKELPSGTTVSLNFSVYYSPATLEGDTDIVNQGFVCANYNGGAGDTDYKDDKECDSDTDPGPTPTNPTSVKSEKEYGVDISDTGSPSTSGEGGDDTGVDDTQTINSAAAGSDIFFYNLVTNTGNTEDQFNLRVMNDGPNAFPSGTTFKFLNDSGSAALVDTTSDAIDDTGTIPAATCLLDGAAPTVIDGISVACNQRLIRVAVSLPASADGGPYEATTTATSYADASKVDSKVEKLLEITGPTTDVSNTPFIAANGDMAGTTNIDPVDVTDGALGADTTPTDDIATVFNDVALGGTITAPIYIANKGGSSDSFTLSAEGSFDTGSSWFTALPTGWVVKFYDEGVDTDADGVVNVAGTGAQIFTTPAIPPGSVMFVRAEITVPTDSLDALANSLQPGTIDANLDGDNDYIISIAVTSAASGATDRKVEAIDVQSSKSITISPPTGANQVQPRGSVIYNHTLINNGNTTETDIKLTSVDDAGFTHKIEIDTDGVDGPDTALTALCTGAPAATPISSSINVEGQTIELTCKPDGTPMFELEPGENIPMTVTVFGPSDAAPGTVNITTITGESDSDPTLTAKAEDTTEIISGQVRLSKFVAPDATCDGTPDTKFTQYYDGIEPGQCVIWMLVALNQGTTPALNTKITDANTEDSTLHSGGSLADCRLSVDTPVYAPADAGYPLDTAVVASLGNLCYPGAGTGTTITESAAADGSILFDVGTLNPGDKAVGIFTIKVD